MSLNAKGSWSTLEGDMDGLKILESEDQLIIGLDFGTTFRYVLIVSTQGFLLKDGSGIAYAFTNSNKPELGTILDWPGEWLSISPNREV